MTDDLKKLAEAAKAAEDAFGVENAKPGHDPHLPSDKWLEAYVAWGAASGNLHEAATPDVILNLIRERDEWRAKYNRLSDRVTAEGQYTTEAELERLGNDLSAAQEEVGRLRAVMRETSEYLRKLEGNMLANDADMMLDDCLPPSFHADQIDQALTKEPPHAG